MSDQKDQAGPAPDMAPEAGKAPGEGKPQDGGKPEGRKGHEGKKPADGKKGEGKKGGDAKKAPEAAQGAPAPKRKAATIPRIKERYGKEILPEVAKAFDIKNPMALPRLEKVCLSMGVGKHHTEANVLKQFQEDLSAISGQRAVVTKAKKSEASFKIREGVPVGIRVTLRCDRMWEFLDRFLNVASPRIRDFRGFSGDGFDEAGNYSCGITEQNIFPEVNLDKMEVTQGLNVNIVFHNSDPKKSRLVLEKMGFPFQRGRN